MSGIRLPSGAPLDANKTEHREFIQEVGEIISGHKALKETDEYIFVYRIPAHISMERYYRLREMSYGRIDWNDNGYFVESQTRRKWIIALDDAANAMEYLDDLSNLVHTERRKIAIPANEQLERSGREHATPAGDLGHLLKEYDKLLDQIRTEYFRHRDRQQP